VWSWPLFWVNLNIPPGQVPPRNLAGQRERRPLSSGRGVVSLPEKLCPSPCPSRFSATIRNPTDPPLSLCHLTDKNEMSTGDVGSQASFSRHHEGQHRERAGVQNIDNNWAVEVAGYVPQLGRSGGSNLAALGAEESRRQGAQKKGSPLACPFFPVADPTSSKRRRETIFHPLVTSRRTRGPAR